MQQGPEPCGPCRVTLARMQEERWIRCSEFVDALDEIAEGIHGRLGEISKAIHG